MGEILTQVIQSSKIMPILITPERPDTTDARTLIAELEDELQPLYPQQSRHGYSVEKLIAQGVAFFVMREEAALVGCGGIQLYGNEYGELKRMYVRSSHRGRRLSELMVSFLADYARTHDVYVLRLETGIYQTAAIKMYERIGFRSVPPFGSYKEDPLSRFYEMQI